METKEAFKVGNGDKYSDPTYEAWKHVAFTIAGESGVGIPILPMRHGNRHFKSWVLKRLKFRSYLWGMETAIWQWDFKTRFYSDPTYEAWKPKFSSNLAKNWKIPILPMRHGNFKLLKLVPLLLVKFRSYLWGMETFFERRLSFKGVFIPILPMRHGNWWPGRRDNCRVFAFRSYLWGMETHAYCYLEVRWQLFRSYLWGMETNWACSQTKDWRAFRSYLWGMETKVLLITLSSDVDIPILPMRHGNSAKPISSNFGIFPFRSYLWGMETWAISCWHIRKWEFRSYLWGMETPLGPIPLHPPAAFRSYLWGMETRYIPIYHRRHSITFRSYLWGMETPFPQLLLTPKYLQFRSYLWGMETHIPDFLHKRIISNSDPTYEAWKLLSFHSTPIYIPRIPILPMRHGNSFCSVCMVHYRIYSDPTYEAWKLIIKPSCSPIIQNSDPTYEAWKRRRRLNWFLVFSRIPILPMRHGNLNSLYEWEHYSFIPILPMRHGNCVKSKINREVDYGFRSYLWGMETSV